MAEETIREKNLGETELPKSRPYRLTMRDERKNKTVFSFRMSIWLVALLSVMLTALTAVLAILIVVQTPLRQYLPGYLDVTQRGEVVDLAMRLDSLEKENKLRASYLSNLTSILQDTYAGADSIVEYDSTVVRFGDSLLLDASDRERTFREAYEQRERFGINAALGVDNPTVAFLSPAIGTLVKDSLARGESRMVRLQLNKENAVMSPFAGIVVAVDLAVGEGYKVMVLRSDGYLVSISHLTKPLCTAGDLVKAGEVLGHAGGQPDENERWIGIQLWYKGIEVEPKNLMSF